MAGSQHLIEGVLIRGQSCSTVAVRRPDGTIALRSDPIGTLFTGRLRKMPLVRGVLALVESLTLGMRALIYSANVGMELEGEEIGKGTIAGILAFSLLFSLGLFFLLPVVTSELLGNALGASDIMSNLAEGIIRLADLGLEASGQLVLGRELFGAIADRMGLGSLAILQQVVIPIPTIGGTLADPKPQPDFSMLARALAGNLPLRRGAGKLLNRVKGLGGQVQGE